MLAASCSTVFLDNLEGRPTALLPFSVGTTTLSSPVISPAGTIHVIGYTPSEGECGVPITVRIHFQPGVADSLYVRLVIGDKAIATKVSELHDCSYGRWQIGAHIPPSDPHLPTKVPLSIQAVNRNNEVLDSVVFGEFSYWSSGSSSFSTTSSQNTNPEIYLSHPRVDGPPHG